MSAEVKHILAIPRTSGGRIYGQGGTRIARVVRTRPLSAEENMIAALLARAHRDLWGKEAELAKKVRRWFDSKSRQEFSFIWCCEATGLDAGVVRRLMSEEPDQDKAGKSVHRVRTKA